MDTNMSRRGFLNLMVGATAVIVCQKVPTTLAPVPILYGDGIHDDTKALQALIDGKVVEFAKPGMQLDLSIVVSI